ncbi:MAG: hypothetical protein M1144_01560 [Candidatus Thermoplasmatota archaeon]|jgi:hypothetical protein|nr:hypothetical protein [Candidatus Thermoplasmatota archaeon]
MVDYVSLTVAIVAIVIAILSWGEARKQNRVLRSMASSLAFIARRKKSAKTSNIAIRPVDRNLSDKDEARKLRLELEREKFQWQKQKDVARAIGWLVSRLDEDEED